MTQLAAYLFLPLPVDGGSLLQLVGQAGVGEDGDGFVVQLLLVPRPAVDQGVAVLGVETVTEDPVLMGNLSTRNMPLKASGLI